MFEGNFFYLVKFLPIVALTALLFGCFGWWLRCKLGKCGATKLELEESRKQVESLEDELRRAHVATQACHADLSEVKSDTEEKLRENASLMDEKSGEIKRLAAELSAAQSASKMEIARLASAQDSSASELKRAVDAKDQETKRLAALQTEFADLKRAVDAKDQEIKRLAEGGDVKLLAERKEAEIKRLKEEHAQTLAGHKSVITELQRNLNDKDGQIDSLSNQEAELEELRRAMEEKNQEIARLRSERLAPTSKLVSSTEAAPRKAQVADSSPQQLGLFSAPSAKAPPETESSASRAPGTKLPEATEILGKKVAQDDLKIVEGIGPKIEELFHEAGIKTWKDLADAEVSRLRGILTDAGPRFKMHDPATWPKQSDLAHKGEWPALRALQEDLHGGTMG